MAKYSELRKQYPAYVTKEQLWKIAGICKEHAKWLLDEGIIPCENTGKKTRKYRIALKDIIKYLRLRDEGKAPRPIINKKGSTKYINAYHNKSKPFSKAYASDLFKDAPDVLLLRQFCGYVGMSGDTVREKIRHGIISAKMVDRKYYVLKSDAIIYVTSLDYAKHILNRPLLSSK